MPGISRILGERCRSHSIATCMGVALSDAAAVSIANDCQRTTLSVQEEPRSPAHKVSRAMAERITIGASKIHHSSICGRDYPCKRSGWNCRSHAIVLSFNSVASAIIAFNSWSDTAPATS